jgi:hypothetical protein
MLVQVQESYRMKNTNELSSKRSIGKVGAQVGGWAHSQAMFVKEREAFYERDV